jgi:magnesium-transporting ATPase (P-type)
MRRSIFRSGNVMRNKPLVVSVAAGLLLAFIAFLVPPIRDLLQLVPLNWGQWGLVFAVALFLLGVEIGKFITYHRRRPATSQVLEESFERKPA